MTGRQEEHANNKYQRGGEIEHLKRRYAERLEGCKDEQHQD